MPGADASLSPNVGRLDAILRCIAGVTILGSLFFVATRFPEGYLVTLVIHPAILAAYLLLSAGSRTDVVYHIFGIDTRRRGRAPRPSFQPPPFVGGRRSV